MELKDTYLEPCPLCGGKAEIVDIKQMPGICDATIVCQTCGLRLEWSQTFVEVVHPSGKKTYIPIDLSPDQAWNRRYSK